VTAVHEPPVGVLAGMREVARVSTPISDADLEQFVAWAETTFGDDLVAHGDAHWLTLYAPRKF